MARHPFGGDMASWVFTAGPGNTVTFAPGSTLTLWDSQVGGAQYTDLAAGSDGSGPMTTVTSSDGSGVTAAGDIPVFYGPDHVTWMWASANGQARRLMVCTDLAALAAVLNSAQAWSALQTFSPSAVGNAAVRVKGLASQSADPFQQVDSANTVLASMTPAGLWRAPNLGHMFTWTSLGTLSVAAGALRIYNDTGVQLAIRAVRASVGTAPTGAAIRIDINKNGTTIFSTQGNRPNVAVSTNTSKVTNMDVTSLADGDYLTMDVDVVGSSQAGANLVVQVLCW